MPPQTEEQRKAAMDAAGLNAGQQSAVVAGTQYQGPTMDELFSNAPSAPAIDPTASAIFDSYKADATSVIDPVETRRKITADFQDRIDAINNIAAQQLAQVRARVGRENDQRTGQTNAIVAARGLGGSIRGAGIQTQTQEHNREVLSAEEAQVNAAKTNALMGLYSQIDAAVSNEVALKTEAKRQGASAYIDYLKTQGESKKGYVGEIASYLFDNDIDPTTLDAGQLDQLIKKGGSLGVSKGDIFAAFTSLKAKADEEAKAPKTIPAGAVVIDSEGNVIFSNASEKDETITVPEGSAIVDRDGNVLFKNPKTYNPNEGGITPSQMFTRQSQLADDVRADPDIKDFIQVRDGYQRVKTGAGLNNAQGDLSLLFGYMKLLDPTSVVRETEFANAEAAMGYAQRILNIPDKALKGERLTEQARKDFSAAAEALYASKKANYDRATAFYGDRANAAGVDPSLIMRDFTAADAQDTGSIRVKLSDGRTGTIDASEFDPATMTKI